MKKLVNVVLSKLALGILNDPVYKDFYVLKSVAANGDIVLSPVMDHGNYLIYESGLRNKVITREIKDFCTLGRGSEDEMTDLLYSEQNAITQFYNSIEDRAWKR